MKVFSFIICFVFSIGLHAQSEMPMDSIRIDTVYHQYYTAIWKVTPRDTFAVATIAPVQIYAYCPNRSRKKSMDKMERKVAKVYPYARAAGDVMRAYEAKCKVITDPKQQKALLDQAEAQMKAQFEKDLRQMTISEGVILVKLIDRETGNTSYKLVQELRGKMSAFMWQGMARIFGQNLKDEYDPHGEDVAIENIVQRIEDGTIPVQYKEVSGIMK